ncbi:MAG: DUF1778 domain-containing protein [Bifidobacteriaceae bacterium]|nr:DUF1778 domain-containing protein [Bifidobacteriaceae bacterium]
MTTTAKNSRLALRVSTAEKQIVQEAARMAGLSLTEFSWRAVKDRADQVLAERPRFDVPGPVWDAFVEALDAPPQPVPENVVSEARKPKRDPRVAAWLRAQSAEDVAISVVTVIELEVGILLVARRDPSSGALLQAWLRDAVLPGFAGRILGVDLPVARRVAPLHVPDRMSEHDVIIAGTALAHRLTVVTRNTKHFSRAGVSVLNPWEWVADV